LVLNLTILAHLPRKKVKKGKGKWGVMCGVVWVAELPRKGKKVDVESGRVQVI
jgi:hypothetical protein